MEVVVKGHDTDVAAAPSAGAPVEPPKEEIDCCWRACAYGDLEKLQQFYAEDPNCIHRPVDNYFPIQWASLNNRAQVLHFLIEKGARINATDHTGQTALHWAAVTGAVQAADSLLRSGADIRLADNRGYTVSHIAAQYGQVAFLYPLIVRWNADLDTVDVDGRSPLHWAAYKGYCDVIRLLLFCNVRIDVPDKNGCTPLHWTAIRGHGDAAQLLMHGGAKDLLSVKEVTGNTPSQLAKEKGHEALSRHLASARSAHERSKQPQKSIVARGIRRLAMAPFVWVLISSLLAMFARFVMNSPSLPPMTPVLLGWSWCGITVLAVAMWFMCQTTFCDPGFVPRGGTEPAAQRASSPASCKGHAHHGSDREDSALKPSELKVSSESRYFDVDEPALWAGHWQQLCVSCKIVRPIRAKHCNYTDRCVEVYDHYCPWVGNAVAKNNRHTFLGFLITVCTALAIGACIAGYRLQQMQDWDNTTDVAGIMSFIILSMFLLLSISMLMLAQIASVGANITTNEQANWRRYKYMQDLQDRFRNPFNRGIWNNIKETITPHKQPRLPTMLPEHLQPKEGEEPSCRAPACCARH